MGGPRSGAAGATFFPFVLNDFSGLAGTLHLAHHLNLLQIIAANALINNPYRPAIGAGKWMTEYKTSLSQRIASSITFVTFIIH